MGRAYPSKFRHYLTRGYLGHPAFLSYRGQRGGAPTGYVPNVIAALAKGIGEYEGREMPPLGLDTDYEKRLLGMQTGAIRREARLAEEKMNRFFANRGMLGSGQQAKALQQLSLSEMLDVGDAAERAALMNAQRRLEELQNEEGRRRWNLEYLRMLGTNAPGGIPQGASSLPVSQGGSWGSALGGLLGAMAPMAIRWAAPHIGGWLSGLFAGPSTAAVSGSSPIVSNLGSVPTFWGR